jgi:hypothetical protein
MFNQPNKNIFQFVLILGFFLLLSACNGRPRGVLDQKDMTKILIDMHKTEALLSEKGLSYGSYSSKAPYYSFVLKKYGITQAQFDSSLVWYTKNPQKFGRIYDDVTAQLTKFQKEIKRGKYHDVDTLELAKIKVNIWMQRTKYILTKDSARTHLDFNIPNQGFMYGDTYILKLLLRIAPEDSSVRQRVILRINYANGKVDSVYKTAYHDSLLRRFTFRFPAIRKLKIKSVSGQLLGSSAYKGKLNATVDSIALFRQFNPILQDSLRKMVRKADPKEYNSQPKLNHAPVIQREQLPLNIRERKLAHPQ